MSAMTIKVLPSRPPMSADALARGLAAFIFLASLLVVLFAGTFPFDFAAPEGDAWLQVRRSFDTRWIRPDPSYTDAIQNVFFLMPFGFGVAAVVRPRRLRALVQLAAAFVLSAMLSTAVEVTQAFVSFRDPSLVDIWCNTLGGVIGALVYVAVGDLVLRVLAGAMLALKPLAKPTVLGTGVALLAALHLSSPYLMRNPGDLSVWNPTLPLLIGNELSGDRGWRGAVWDVALADRAANDEEIMALCRNANPADVFGERVIGRYRLRGEAPYKDDLGGLPELNWAGAPAPISNGSCVLIEPENWLKSSAAAVEANQRVGRSSQFTLTTTAASYVDVARRRWPARLAPWRIVSLSDSLSRQNVLIGQDQLDLAVRVRTALRSTPTLYLRNVFEDVQAHHIAVTQNGAVTIIYVDGVERGRCEVTPEAKMIWRLYPRGSVKLRLERYGFRSYAAIYRLLVFIPFAALLGATLITSRLGRTTRRVIAIGVIVAFALVLEFSLGAEAASGFQIKNLLISLTIGLCTIGVLALWRRRSRE